MKWNRIVKHQTNRGNAALLQMKEMAAGLLFVFLLPYVCACFWGHVGADKDKVLSRQETEEGYTAQIAFTWGFWEVPLEEYLVYKLSDTMPEAYETEALKAQAVLLRTEFVRSAQELESQCVKIDGEGMEIWYRQGAEQEETAKYQSAVSETRGIILSYEGEAALAAYYPVSSGRTRSASEVLHTEYYPYLTGRECAADRASPEYEQELLITEQEYRRKLSKLIDVTDLKEGSEAEPVYDSAGYVIRLCWGEDGKTECDGEDFRHLFGLPSAAFTMQYENGQIRFRVKGRGHGFGMSQYAANCMALGGSTYQEILQTFFEGTELLKI